MNDWTEDLALLKSKGFTADENGNQIADYERVTVQASRKPIQMSEFYAAAQSGIRPAYEFIIHPFEYEDETEVEYKGVRYTVIRVYQTSYDEMEIYLQRKVGDENG